MIAKKLLFVAALAACSNGSSKAPTTAPATTVPAASPEPRAAAPSPSRVEEKRFASAALGVEKRLFVYLPANYDADPARRWPVFYYLHGLGSEEKNWLAGGKIDEAANALALGAILVMPDGDDSFYTNAATPTAPYDDCLASGAGLAMPKRPRPETCVRKRDYETYIVSDLLGFVDKTYRTIATREGRGIAGLSMGGFGALKLAMRHPDLFAAAASHSGVVSLLYAGPWPYAPGKVVRATDVKTWGQGFGPIGDVFRGVFGPDIANWRANDPAVLAESLAPGKLALYLDCGTEDEFQLQNGMQHLHEILTARKIEHAYYIGPGNHSYAFWGPRVSHSLEFLRKNTQAAK